MRVLPARDLPRRNSLAGSPAPSPGPFPRERGLDVDVGGGAAGRPRVPRLCVEERPEGHAMARARQGAGACAARRLTNRRPRSLTGSGRLSSGRVSLW